jgi:hypothetical protein
MKFAISLKVPYLTSTHSTLKITFYDVRNPGSTLGQAQSCGGAKQ